MIEAIREKNIFIGERAFSMKIKHIEYAKEVLTEQMNHWMLFPLVLTVMGISRTVTGIHKPDLLLWELCSIFPLIMFIIRCKVNRFYIFALLHVGIAGLVLGLLYIPSFRGGVCVVAAFVYAALSLRMQMKGRLYSEPIPLPVGVAVSAVAILLQHHQGTDSWDAYYTITLIGTIVLFFIIFYLQHYLDFLAVNQSSAGYLPASEMFRSGLGLTLGYTLPGAAVLFISTHFTWLSDILHYVKDFLIWLLRLLLSNLSQGTPEEDEIINQVVDTPIDNVLPGGEPFWLLEVLWQILGCIILAAVIVVLTKLLFKFIRWLHAYLVMHRAKEDVQEENAFDVREKCDLEKNTEKKKENFFGSFSYRERIRKLYKKKLLSASIQMSEQEKNRLAYDTAREWEEKLKTKGMAALYEQARYSDREVTGTDVKKMREACKNH